MEFNVLAYLDNDPSVKEIKEYNKYISTGVLIDEDMLYLLIVGDFVNNHKNKVAYLSMKKNELDLEDFECLIKFLNGIRAKLFITPHIFTKFIHLLWDNINNKSDYKKIIKIFDNFSDYIQEEHLDKGHFFEEENFTNMEWDLVNSSLILTSKNHKHNTILTYRNKTHDICNSQGCLVILHENIKSAYLTKKYN